MLDTSEINIILSLLTLTLLIISIYFSVFIFATDIPNILLITDNSTLIFYFLCLYNIPLFILSVNIIRGVNESVGRIFFDYIKWNFKRYSRMEGDVNNIGDCKGVNYKSYT
ncbi:hypothetical protein CWI38_1553p0020 [Hamiltosporidium tvaerminnensis]|uniref:Uncharacterized protein n=2 Tax=Hamiltosporidium TaxID=1176354 RepID=A0A4Q9LAM5_9MICR|nr:hypothetical protein CWI36_0707p0030 [Hamiltosporidium magnivora]TBU07699.1 hypothetical protein CWI39_0282p0030 [Hamiltosporidium magnivora]TBU10780.1 hypothetical protein CWI38_1553p0020 [Hamiltosporidium tvaerminnensis]